jgi:hypothetical protein
MRRLTTIVLVAAVGVGAIPGIAWGGQDFRSPDARDSARQVAAELAAAREAQDFRSPDARDSARRIAGGAPSSSLTPRPAAPQAPVVQAPGEGFSWGDAGVGAAGTLALGAIGLGAFLIVGQRRRDRRLPIATS